MTKNHQYIDLWYLYGIFYSAISVLFNQAYRANINSGAFGHQHFYSWHFVKYPDLSAVDACKFDF